MRLFKIAQLVGAARTQMPRVPNPAVLLLTLLTFCFESKTNTRAASPPRVAQAAVRRVREQY